MGRFFDALKAGVAGFKEEIGPDGYSIAGRSVRCPHCTNTTFARGRALLNSAGLTLVNLDWADPAATILICSECGHIEWFAQEPDRVDR
jgi:hypothetical protein